MSRHYAHAARQIGEWSDMKVIVTGLGISLLMIAAVVLSAVVSAVIV